MCDLLALVPQASNKTLGKLKHFGIPLSSWCLRQGRRQRQQEEDGARLAHLPSTIGTPGQSTQQIVGPSGLVMHRVGFTGVCFGPGLVSDWCLVFV